jgi:hypothetical protein
VCDKKKKEMGKHAGQYTGYSNGKRFNESFADWKKYSFGVAA